MLRQALDEVVACWPWAVMTAGARLASDGLTEQVKRWKSEIRRNG